MICLPGLAALGADWKRQDINAQGIASLISLQSKRDWIKNTKKLKEKGENDVL